MIKNELNLKPGDTCPRCRVSGKQSRETGEPGKIRRLAAGLSCDYCGKIFELIGVPFRDLPDGELFKGSIDNWPGEFYYKGKHPDYVSDNPNEIPPNAYLAHSPTLYCRFGPEATVQPASRIEKMIVDFIREDGPAQCGFQGDEDGVMFLDEHEFIPWSDLGYNSDLGFYRLSLFPDVENEAAK